MISWRVVQERMDRTPEELWDDLIAIAVILRLTTNGAHIVAIVQADYRAHIADCVAMTMAMVTNQGEDDEHNW